MLGPSLIRLLLRCLLGFNSSLLAHGGENDNVCESGSVRLSKVKFG